MTKKLLSVLVGILIISMATGCSPKKSAEQAAAEAQVAELTAKLEKMESSQKQRRERGERGQRRGNSEQANEPQSIVDQLEDSIENYVAVVQQLASDQSLSGQAEALENEMMNVYAQLISLPASDRTPEEQSRIDELSELMETATATHNAIVISANTATTPATTTQTATTAKAGATSTTGTTSTTTPPANQTHTAKLRGEDFIVQTAPGQKGIEVIGNRLVSKTQEQINGYLVIPNGVTYIGKEAFIRNAITGVTISDSVTEIDEMAFWQNDITSVILGKSVTTIGRLAFADANITSLTIPASVTKIGELAFGGSPLTKITFEENNTPAVNSIGGDILQQLYKNFGAGTYTRPNATSDAWTKEGGFNVKTQEYSIANGKLTINNGVTTIEDFQFQKMNLTSVVIPNSVTKIGEGAFKDNQITSVTIPNSVKTIGTLAFQQNQLTSVTIPNSVTTIGTGTFSYNKITSVTIPASVTSIGNDPFANNPLTSVTIEGTSQIYMNAFAIGADEFRGGKGTYTRANVSSPWKKQVSAEERASWQAQDDADLNRRLQAQ